MVACIPFGVRFDRPVCKLSMPGIAEYTSHERGRSSSCGSPITEWSSELLLGGASPRSVYRTRTSSVFLASYFWSSSASAFSSAAVYFLVAMRCERNNFFDRARPYDAPTTASSSNALK